MPCFLLQAIVDEVNARHEKSKKSTEEFEVEENNGEDWAPNI